MDNFETAGHTLVVSDIHLADIEIPQPHRPLWKRYKHTEHFVDQTFLDFLVQMQAQIKAPVELVLNGDIFDFDSVMALPEKTDPLRVRWLERMRGLSSEEPKSRFKMQKILDGHPVWLTAIKNFILNGNRVIFVIGNHDMELHWPSVRQDIIQRLELPEDKKESIRFCEWFYISNRDSLIEHGNQYDSYCLCSNPVHPLIKKGSRVLVRLPFGNLAGKYMINGIGLMNPHATGTYIKKSLWEYLGFYYKYMIRVQPFLLWTWFWSALVTLIASLSEGFLPALRDPLTVDARIEDIAKRANTSIYVVLALKEVHVHPAIFNPFKILRELWLDRAILLGIIIFGSFQFFSFLHVFMQVSVEWFIVPLLILLPGFIFYARSVQSEVDDAQNAALQMAPTSAKIAKVKRVIHGHTHIEHHLQVEGVEIINTGTWSPAFHDVECKNPYGRKCFAWIRPAEPGLTPGAAPGLAPEIAPEIGRTAGLYEWNGNTIQKITGFETL